MTMSGRRAAVASAALAAVILSEPVPPARALPPVASSAAARVTRRLEDRVHELQNEVREAAALFGERNGLLQSVRDQSERAEADMARLEARLAELDERRATAARRRGERVEALYRAGRLGNPRTLLSPDQALRAMRLSRYLAALAVADDGRDEDAEIERGSILLELGQAELRRSGIERQARDLEMELVADRRALAEGEARLAGAQAELAMLLGEAPADARPGGLAGLADDDLLALAGLGDGGRQARDDLHEEVLADFEVVGEGPGEAFDFPDLGEDASVAATGEDPRGSLAGVAEDAGKAELARRQAEQIAREAEEMRLAEERRKAEEARRRAEALAEADREAALRARQAADSFEDAFPVGDASARAAASAAESAVAEADRATAKIPEEGPSTASSPAAATDAAFARLKGSLKVPMRGRVIARFGQSHESGALYRGLIVRGAGGGAVTAVATGDVIFAGEFPGLGATLILSHGERYHTVYARMASVRFPVGVRVDRGTVLGAMPAGDGDLHFEMRLAGKPFDPLPWFPGGASAFGG